MSSEFGNKLKISVFGQSHGKAIGVVINGLPAGERIDIPELERFIKRRSPGESPLSTARKEADNPIFFSGIEESVLTGAPLCAIIQNTDTHSSDYKGLSDTPRPSHADYTAAIKWQGNADMRGGGHFSGRLTAPLCIAGGIAKQLLEKKGIYVGAHLSSVGNEDDDRFPLFPDKSLFKDISEKPFPIINDLKGKKMQSVILAAKESLDSVGGTIECAVTGLPVGLGDPMFGTVEGRISYALFGVPAVKGVEFGSGFEGSRHLGSENNDPFCIDKDGNIITATNNCGGILGGISNGMPLILTAAIKPTPSIGKEQKTVSLSDMKETELIIKGRHDPCIAHRAVPVIEATVAAVILDMLLEK